MSDIRFIRLQQMAISGPGRNHFLQPTASCLHYFVLTKESWDVDLQYDMMSEEQMQI